MKNRLSSGDVFNKIYTIIEHIGKGSTSEVYKVSKKGTTDHFALKIMHDVVEISSSEIRFSMEARSLLSINHPNIIKVFDFIDTEDRKAIVLELLEGQDLKQLLRSNGPLEQPEALKIAIGIAEGLSGIHAMNIIHRDVKPQNVFIGYDSEVKLMDFGTIQASQTQELTAQGKSIGTIEYMSPEICRAKKATPKTDVYSLGIVIYYMLTGALPFNGADDISIAKKQVFEMPTPPIVANPEISLTINSLILKMLEKDADDRPTVDYVLQVLKKALNIPHFEKPTIPTTTKMKKKKLFGRKNA
ncbi:MAG: hypothetical protein DRP42_03980 [Tenericutes bacterium]|nr:MAG: hypothetical protein DRP42_03980 [Mycoplasmatota bacterium]